MRARLPASLVDSVLAYERGKSAAVSARDAATVVLLRDSSPGMECYLLRRRSSMAFAAGMSVFPGGAVDPRDAAGNLPWAGPEPSAWALRLSCSAELAQALVCAAVRETFEEAGVLLAGPHPGAVVADLTDADWEADRSALVDGTLSLGELLRRRRLVLRADLLHAWTHWITPEFEPRRYDTRFFVAALPAGQHTRDVSTESDTVAWMTPADALALAEAGAVALMPPTQVTLEEIQRFGRADDVLAAAGQRRIDAILPRAVRDGSGLWLETSLP